jgi:hypothetical protein
VTGVAFDPWKCDEKVYRLGSVGEDCKLILWDFSVSALHRPRHVSIYNEGYVDDVELITSPRRSIAETLHHWLVQKTARVPGNHLEYRQA